MTGVGHLRQDFSCRRCPTPTSAQARSVPWGTTVPGGLDQARALTGRHLPHRVSLCGVCDGSFRAAVATSDQPAAPGGGWRDLGGPRETRSARCNETVTAICLNDSSHAGAVCPGGTLARRRRGLIRATRARTDPLKDPTPGRATLTPEERVSKTPWRIGAVVAASALVVAPLTFNVLAAPAAPTHVDNHYAGATQYVNPAWSASVEAAAGRAGDATLAAKVRAIENQPTAVWMDRISAIAGNADGGGLKSHLDAALAQKGTAPIVLNVVIYDLPGRDCYA